MNRALYPDLYRGLDIVDAVHTPGSWRASYGPRSPHTSNYHPANSGKPYNWWTRYKRPNFLLVVDFQSTGDCDPSTHNCGTTVKVELDERTVD